tara:strand:+ start:166 stop:882 length:717 start_codon:yes stop_codon:yes gene_type:complete
MKSLILAAGSGKRIPKFTKKIPKCLIKVSNKPIILRQIELMNKNKLSKIAIVKGFKGNKINFKRIKYYKNSNYIKNDQLESLFYARKYFNDDVLITFSDIIYDENILKKIIKSKGPLTIAIEKNWIKRYSKRFDHPPSQADKVVIKNNKVVEIGKTVPIKKANGEFLGIFKVSKKMWKTLIKYYEIIKKEKKTDKLQIHDFFQYLINKKVNITPCYSKGRYMEIDTYNDFKIAEETFK